MAHDGFDILKDSDTVLAGVVGAALTSTAAKVQEQLNRPLRLTAQAPVLANRETFAELAAGRFVLLAGELEQANREAVGILLPLGTAITLTASLRMVPEENAHANRSAGIWTEADGETAAELGTLAFAALDEALRARPGAEAGASFVSVSAGDAATHIQTDFFGDTPFLIYPFACTLEDADPERGFLLLPLAPAEAINGQPVHFAEEGVEEAIAAAPIRGALAAYVAAPDVLRVLRMACRRVGLTLDKRPKNEVPNPAAWVDQIVLIEIGRGQERRFDWCRRLKSADQTIKVLLVLREPTKIGVALAFKARADAVVGFPARERDLSAKLASLLELEPAR